MLKMTCWEKDASHQRLQEMMQFIGAIQNGQWGIWAIDTLGIEAHEETHGNGLSLRGWWQKYSKMRICWQLYNSANIFAFNEGMFLDMDYFSTNLATETKRRMILSVSSWQHPHMVHDNDEDMMLLSNANAVSYSTQYSTWLFSTYFKVF